HVVERMHDRIVHGPAELRVRMEQQRNRRAGLLGLRVSTFDTSGGPTENHFRHVAVNLSRVSCDKCRRGSGPGICLLSGLVFLYRSLECFEGAWRAPAVLRVIHGWCSRVQGFPRDDWNSAMKLSTKGRYAVMAMADIALNATGKPVPLGDVADRQGISQEYLEQLFAKLRRANLVESARGPGGGYTLSREPDEIGIAEIIQAV